nr:MAG TPA: hypothetical protein [Caudoviricetes sp.]
MEKLSEVFNHILRGNYNLWKRGETKRIVIIESFLF